MHRWARWCGLQVGHAGAVFATLLVSSCGRKDTATTALASAASAASTPGASSPPAGSQALATPEPLSGFDSCLVGKWKTSRVSFQFSQMTGEGGANVTLEVAPSGASVTDFSSMSDMHATSHGIAIDYRYGGKASATLKTPNRGSLEADHSEYTHLTVTANMKVPGAASVSMFKDTPLKDIAAMGTALVGARAGKNKAALAGPGSGIESSPVFSSQVYTCSGDTLTLKSQAQNVSWLFNRAGN